ncbi:MAG: DNA primase catalytic subunit PriS [Candidatus Anstonellaceae archaeon]
MADEMAMGAEERFVRESFAQHYRKVVLSVHAVEQREFGFGGWEKKIEFRHIKIKSAAELQGKLALEAPLYVSYSVSYYEFPEARPMPKKSWLGADLVFDLDAQPHECGKFTCSECLEKVKHDTAHLIEEFLMEDFGVQKHEIEVNFSGSRGYHVHVRNSNILKLDRDARREIADYISGVGVSFDRFFWKEGKKLFGPTPTQEGYGGKFAASFCKKLEDEKFANSIWRGLKSQKGRLVEAIGRGDWGSCGIPGFEKKLQKAFEEMKKELSVMIDSNVTADVTKLIRLPDSLHGGSGLVAKKVKNLDAFDPMRDAVAFGKEEVKIKLLEKIPSLLIGDFSFGPADAGCVLEVPKFAAIYLLCKKAATLA